MRIVVAGAGVMGLCTAMLLAGDGHEVVVLERDPAPPPDPSDSWDSWERRGVNQFRLAHMFLARFREVVEAEMPQLKEALRAAGALRFNIVDSIPDEIKGGARPTDTRYDLLTGRRAVVESVAARLCEETPGVTVRRGAAVNALVTATPARPGTPHITGVELDGGERISADLVVDATGRRSPLPRWLDAAGARPIGEVLDDSGFTYYGRHFSSPDGSLPAVFGALKQDYGSIGILTLPADNGTWSVTLIASSKDAAMRKVTDPEKWAAVVRLLPFHAHWIDATPIDDRVGAMGKIEDRIRDFAPGGQPVATGVVAVADSWSCTNPSLGRGASIGIMHALALRNLLREDAGGDPWEFARNWAELTDRDMKPWFDTTVHYDRHRLAEIEALIDGRSYTTDDETWRITRRLEKAATADPDLLRTFVESAMCLRRADEVLADPGVIDKINKLPDPADADQIGPSREQLVATVAA